MTDLLLLRLFPSGTDPRIRQVDFLKYEIDPFGSDPRGVFDKLLGDPDGITQAIRDVLRFAPSMQMTAMTIRNQFVARGFDFSHYSSNPLSAINSILKRLDGIKVRKSREPDGKAYYCWNP